MLRGICYSIVMQPFYPHPVLWLDSVCSCDPPRPALAYSRSISTHTHPTPCLRYLDIFDRLRHIYITARLEAQAKGDPGAESIAPPSSMGLDRHLKAAAPVPGGSLNPSEHDKHEQQQQHQQQPSGQAGGTGGGEDEHRWQGGRKKAVMHVQLTPSVELR